MGERFTNEQIQRQLKEICDMEGHIAELRAEVLNRKVDIIANTFENSGYYGGRNPATEQLERAMDRFIHDEVLRVPKAVKDQVARAVSL